MTMIETTIHVHTPRQLEMLREFLDRLQVVVDEEDKESRNFARGVIASEAAMPAPKATQ